MNDTNRRGGGGDAEHRGTQPYGFCGLANNNAIRLIWPNRNKEAKSKKLYHIFVFHNGHHGRLTNHSGINSVLVWRLATLV